MLVPRLGTLLVVAGTVYSVTGGNPYFSLLAALFLSDSPLLVNLTASACSESLSLLSQAYQYCPQ